MQPGQKRRGATSAHGGEMEAGGGCSGEALAGNKVGEEGYGRSPDLETRAGSGEL